MDVYTALRNLVPEPGQAIPCHDASNLDLPPTTPSRPNQPARPMMVLVLVVLVVPAPPLVQTGCSAGWEEMSPGPARRPADFGHHTRAAKIQEPPPSRAVAARKRQLRITVYISAQPCGPAAQRGPAQCQQRPLRPPAATGWTEPAGLTGSEGLHINF